VSGTVEEVRDFFEEHPIHGFTTKKIADYLGVTEASVKLAIKILLRLGIIEVRYQKVLK
jgi:Mn-dependent DtxR family transcriptional regulator